MNRYEYFLEDLRYFANDKRHSKATLSYINQAIEAIDDLIQGRSVHAHWIVEKHNAHTTCRCSECGCEFYYFNKGQYQIDNSAYCPNCGADMTGG